MIGDESLPRPGMSSLSTTMTMYERLCAGSWSSTGHRVEMARDGPKGVELALATAPEVAFIDIRLPGIEAGFDAHLVKPVSAEDLTRVLERAAGGDG